MARIRSIKPEFWTSEQVMECSLNARLLFIGMWNFADDLGRLSMSPKSIKAQIFPSDNINSENILGMIQELSDNGLVLIYTVDNKDYLQITGWQHQRIDKPQPGKHPSPVNGYSKNVRGMVATDTIGKEGIGKEESSEANASGACAPPDPSIAERELFDRGKQVLGKSAGGQIAKLKAAKGGNVALARAAIEAASTKQNPAEYIAACCRDGPIAKPLTEFQRKQQETTNVLSELRNSRNSNRGSGTLDRILPDYHREQSEGLRSGAGQALLELPRTSSRGGH